MGVDRASMDARTGRDMIGFGHTVADQNPKRNIIRIGTAGRAGTLYVLPHLVTPPTIIARRDAVMADDGLRPCVAGDTYS